MGKRAQSVHETLQILNSYVSSYPIEEKTTPKLSIWSLKKVMILHDYIKPFLEILRNRQYQNIHYFDPFAGTGLFRVEDKLMPGTPLIPLLYTRDLSKTKSHLIFNSLNYSDADKESLGVLGQRVDKLKEKLQTKINIEVMAFRGVALTKFTGLPPLPANTKKDAYLVMLDPYGYDVEWQLLERILKSGAVDVILTFPSSLANWTKTMANSQDKLTKMYGNEDYLDFDSAEEFVNRYCDKIREVPVINRPSIETEAITVEAGKQTYHLICISSSGAAKNVFSYFQKKYGSLTSEDLIGEFNQAFGKGVWGFEWL